MKVELSHPDHYDAGAFVAEITLEPDEPHQDLTFKLPSLTGITIVSDKECAAAVPLKGGGATIGGRFDSNGRWKGNVYGVGPGDIKKIEAALRSEASSVVNAAKAWRDAAE